MSLILIADTPAGASTLSRILEGHDLVFVSTLAGARAELQKRTFDLTVAAVRFDESQMFELIREIRKCPQNTVRPIICFCSKETLLARLMHESLELTTRALGAWMYLSEIEYSVYQDPDAELRRVIERCLTEECRKEIQRKRINIQLERYKIQELRVQLEAGAWTPQLQDFLAGLRKELELLQDSVKELQLNADSQRDLVRSSRNLKDRVSGQVTSNENDMSELEESQSLQEIKQSNSELELGQKEELKQSAGEHRYSSLPRPKTA